MKFKASTFKGKVVRGDFTPTRAFWGELIAGEITTIPLRKRTPQTYRIKIETLRQLVGYDKHWQEVYEGDELRTPGGDIHIADFRDDPAQLRTMELIKNESES